MSINKILKISIMILFAFVFTDIAMSCPGSVPPTIILPQDNDFVLAGGTYTCQATGDPVITWSGPGDFTPTTGSIVSWEVPVAPGYVTITATNAYGSDQVTVKTVDIIYVDEDATEGENDGTSWDDAYLDLQDGLKAASTGNHIWVGQGIYKPGTPDSNTFLLVDGVEVYGGFDPCIGDDTWAERDYINNETILSGDIDKDNTLNGTNSRHVVTCTDEDIDGSTRLDGFTITMGYADYWLCDGAGMKIEDCDPNVANCIFKENRAPGHDGDGGGMGCYNASPEVTNCIFIDNVAGDDGGALVNTYGSNGTFTNCVFYNNNTNGKNIEYDPDDQAWEGKSNGGAIWNTASEKEVPIGSSPTFINCLIAGNSTVPGVYGGKNGGGVANKGSGTNPVFINCTFTENTAYTDGGGMCSKDDAVATVINCVFWDNKALDDDDSIRDKKGGVTNVSYSDVNQPGYAPYNNNICQDPIFANPGDHDGPDDRFLTCDDGWRIRFDSSCVDAGNGTATNAPAADILGLKRADVRAVTNTGLGTPYSDMGAYEAAVEHVIFISVDGLASVYFDYPDETDLMRSVPCVVPNLKRIKDEGLYTYEARNDADWENTLPNHVSMVTGRPVWQGGLTSDERHHGWSYNDTINVAWTLHMGDEDNGRGNDKLDYVASVFDIAHDYDMSTALYAGKSKFKIFNQSYDIDNYEYDDDWDSGPLMNLLLARGLDNFVFFHFQGPDKYGHNRGGWGEDAWNGSVVTVDGHLGDIFDMVENTTTNKDKAWYYNTVIILTADHGGHDTTHGPQSDNYLDYTIPLGVWGYLIPSDGATYDLYDWCDSTRTKPDWNDNPDHDNNYSDQPVRHADGIDLGLSLLGLPRIDGTVDAEAIIQGMKITSP